MGGLVTCVVVGEHVEECNIVAAAVAFDACVEGCENWDVVRGQVHLPSESMELPDDFDRHEDAVGVLLVVVPVACGLAA